MINEKYKQSFLSLNSESVKIINTHNVRQDYDECYEQI